MNVEVDLRFAPEGVAQLYFLAAGASDFSEASSRDAPVHPGGATQTLRFRLDSPVGFSNPLRFDPVGQAQILDIPDIRAYCLVKKE